MQEALDKNWSYLHIISGEDYPILKPQEIINMLHNSNLIYMETQTAMGNTNQHNWWWKFYWPYVKFQQNYKNELIRRTNLAIVGIQCLIPFFWKKHLGEFTNIYRGLLWASYPRDIVKYLIEYIEKHQEYMKDLKWCKIPEELCFQTIIMNSPYKDRVYKNNLRFMIFESRKSSGPRYLNEKDIELISEKQMLFVRKVKQDTSAADILLRKTSC